MAVQTIVTKESAAVFLDITGGEPPFLSSYAQRVTANFYSG